MAARDFAQSLLYDIRLASRSLGRSPGFVVAAVLCLGLAIGAGVAGFSVLDAVRFRALPFPAAHRLVLISEVPKAGCPGTCDVNYKSYAVLMQHTFRSLDAFTGFNGGAGPKSLGRGEEQVDLTVGLLSAAAFPMLGAKPEFGRIFSPEEDRIGGVATMILGHDLWMSQFGGDTAVLGKSVILSDEPYTIIGVMPRGFNFESRSQAWLSMNYYLDPRTGTSLRSSSVLGRLAPGATMEQLASELRTLEAAANEGRPEQTRTTFGVAPLRSRYVNATKSRDLIFAGIVGAILLIGCANVAGLVLVRAIRSRRELAIRTALGASRTRLARYLFVQNMLLTGAGSVIGLALAALSLNALRSAAQLQSGIRLTGMEYRLDLHVVMFTVALAVLAAALLSIAPVRLLSHAQLQQTLREGALTATTARRGNRTQQLLVVLQTACAVALLIGSGLMLKTLVRFSGLDLGYDADRVVQITVIPAHAGRVREKYLPMADRLLLDFAALPGVQASALRSATPLGVARPGESPVMILDGDRPVPLGAQPRTALGVSPDYFKVMGIPLVAGRAFTLTDANGTPAVAIINEWAAQHWWPGENPIGRTFAVDTALGVRATITVVGMVRDNLAAQGSVLLAKPGAEVFRPFAQANNWIAVFFARTSGQPARIAPDVQRAVLRLVPNGRPPARVMSSLIAGQMDSVRTDATQIAGFALVGLLLAITGLYGVLSYIVQQRTQEIGIRGVLGASRRQILAMMLAQALRLTAAGIVVGLVTAVMTTRFIQGMLYGTPPADPPVYGGVAALFLVVALVASYFPARRATRVDPAIAIRAN